MIAKVVHFCSSMYLKSNSNTKKIFSVNKMTTSVQYSGLFIDYDRVLLKKQADGMILSNMVSILDGFSKNCAEMETGPDPHMGVQAMDTDSHTTVIPFKHNPTPGKETVRGLVLILPYNLIQKYNTLSTFLLSSFEKGEPFNHSLGHCWITWEKKSDVCSILDICLHKNPPGGFGSKLVDAIINTLAVQLRPTTTLWLGIDIRNKEFGKIAYLYSKFGFKDPYIDNTDPHGNIYANLTYGFVALSRKNGYVDPSNIDKDKVQSDIIYMLTQYVKINGVDNTDSELKAVKIVKKGVDISVNKNQRYFCSIRMKFSRFFAAWLKTLPTTAQTFNTDNTITLKEVAGAFLLDYPKRELETGDFIWDITLDQRKKVITGTEHTVPLVHAFYNFHTHNKGSYEFYSVEIGYPSGEDYNAFLTALKNNGTIFHCAVTLEGIYFISLAPYWCQNLTDLVKNIDSGGSKLWYHIKDSFAIQKVIPTNMNKKEAGKYYCDYMNNKKLLQGRPPVFHNQFLSWDEVLDESVIEVGYPVLFDQCFATERSYNTMKKFHPSAFIPTQAGTGFKTALSNP